jgi:hypothetical protein
MRTTSSLLLAALVALAAPLAPAHAAAGPPLTPRPCTVRTVPAGAVPPGHEVAVFSAYVAAPGAAAVSVRCSVHAGNETHDGPAVTEATGGPSANAAVIPLAVTTYPYDATAAETVCGEATVDGTTWYWTGLAWSLDTRSGCGVRISPGDCLDYGGCVPWNTVPWDDLPPELQPAVGFVACEAFAFEKGGCLDGLVCPYLVGLAPGLPGVVDVRPDGDIYLAGQFFWDCAPYAPPE